ncbi:MAG: iron-sulfur cluster-binding protein [Rhodospirillales bacterium]|nr:iron-sulfur cluster-binding protein [Rhodospirillales bacterium]
MKSTAHGFKENARNALQDTQLRDALSVVGTNFIVKRRLAADALPEFETLRDEATAIKNRTLNELDLHLERFERKVVEHGGVVHWCIDAAAARETVLSICRSVNAKTVTKGKSMLGEEIGINPFLEANNIRPIETDLGEYIIQLADEPPSHIIAPAVHKTKSQIADLFEKHHKRPRSMDGEALVAEARAMLRQSYFDADVGITGANFLVAETGSSVIVTNEGNGDLTQTLPKIHIVLASIEKLVPTFEDMATILRVLARSATGQQMSVYTTVSTGARRAEDPDGPEQYHVVLIDQGRSAMLGTELQDLLRCIRCGACMNHCPIYHAVGGHAYGWVYPGPIGAALDPALLGVAEAHHLPNASTFCGRCEEVCPMRIPLPKIMRHWRERAFEDDIQPVMQRTAIRWWAFLARRPFLYRANTRLAMWLLHALGKTRGRFKSLPFAGGWTAGRDLPAPQGGTFHAQWAAKGGRTK